MGEEFRQIQNALEETSKEIPGFFDLVNELLSSSEPLSLSRLLTVFLERIKWEWTSYENLFAQITAIVVGAALLKLLTDNFKTKQVGRTGFLITHILLFGILSSSFVVTWRVAESTIEQILQFLQALIPAYFLSVAFCTGSVTALAFYQGTLLAIGLVDMVILHLLLPLVYVYLTLLLINPFMKEQGVEQMADLVRLIIIWSSRTLFGLVMGIQIVQGLILPFTDKVKRSMLYKTAEMLPGVGRAISGVASTVLSTGMLLKNAIGVAGLVLLTALVFIPLGKLIIHFLLYKVVTGLWQPVADKRIIESLSASAEATRLLFYLTGMTILLFALAIILVAVSTGIS